MLTYSSCGRVWINTLDWHPRSTCQSILDQHSVSTSVVTRQTLHQHLGWWSTNFRLIHESVANLPTINPLLIKCWLSVDHLSIWLRIWLKESIESTGRHSTTDAFNIQDPLLLLYNDGGNHFLVAVVAALRRYINFNDFRWYVLF